MTLVERITKVAKRMNMSLADLETKAQIGRRTIRRWDNIDPGSEKLGEVADYLKVDARYLLKGEPASFDATKEQKRFLRGYEKLTLKQQSLIEEIIFSFEQKALEGERKKAYEIAEKMLRNEVSVVDIMTLTDLDEQSVNKIKKNMKKKVKNQKIPIDEQ